MNLKLRKKTTLFIDTASNEYISVGLEINGEEDAIKQKITKQKAQVVLPLIEKLLEKHNVFLQNIGSIQVNEGPGSFTGLRVGIVIAQALCWSLQIPINGKKPGLVEPRYQ